ncbi:hypothetical protein [Streptomyces sp. NPDC056227]|uniref:hypothetical protein n=1 Tax=Streptomyces sp. NPDC056227 TaxID=3345753 RepID=UPI0035E18658
MSDRIRVRQPLLPTLVAHVEGRYEHLTSLLKKARAVELGEHFEHDGHSYRRTVSDRDRTWAKSQDEPPVRVTDEDGQVLNVTLTEDTAFWEWAGLEILRHSGIRVEELCELTHLSIRQYRRPNGEVVALLVIAPSKSERERIIRCPRTCSTRSLRSSAASPPTAGRSACSTATTRTRRPGQSPCRSSCSGRTARSDQ